MADHVLFARAYMPFVQVAIKIIAKERLDSPVKVRRILREVRFLRALHHPHIVRLYDVYESETHIYIVMEYANGGELFDYIVNSQRLRPTKARRFMRQIISALDYCHQVRLAGPEGKIKGSVGTRPN